MLKEWRKVMSKRAVKKGTYGFVEGQGENILKIDTEKKRVVRLMFDLCLDGMSLGQIKDVIEAQGILYPAKYKKDTPIGWSLAEISKILSNPIYSDERYKVVSTQEFKVAQRVLKLNTRVSGQKIEISALVGIAVCSECGNFLVEKSVSSRGRKYLYYICSKYKKNGGCSPHKIAVLELNRSVLEILQYQNMEMLSFKELTRERAIKYLERVCVNSAGEIESVEWNKQEID